VHKRGGEALEQVGGTGGTKLHIPSGVVTFCHNPALGLWGREGAVFESAVDPQHRARRAQRGRGGLTCAGGRFVHVSIKKGKLAKKLGFSSKSKGGKCCVRHGGRGRWVAISCFCKILEAPSGPGRGIWGFEDAGWRRGGGRRLDGKWVLGSVRFVIISAGL